MRDDGGRGDYGECAHELPAHRVVVQVGVPPFLDLPEANDGQEAAKPRKANHPRQGQELHVGVRSQELPRGGSHDVEREEAAQVVLGLGELETSVYYYGDNNMI